MNRKPVIRRNRATQDIDDAVGFYLKQDAEAAALTFIADLERATGFLAENPAIGSPRYGQELNLPGLRSWPLASHPYLIFYVDRPDYVDVWRMLHMHRDVPTTMLEHAAPA